MTKREVIFQSDQWRVVRVTHTPTSQEDLRKGPNYILEQAQQDALEQRIWTQLLDITTDKQAWPRLYGGDGKGREFADAFVQLAEAYAAETALEREAEAHAVCMGD